MNMYSLKVILLDYDRRPLELKRRIPSAVHRRFCSLRGFQHFESQTIKLDLQSRLHQFVLFSHYSSTELSKERLFLVEICAAHVLRFCSVKMGKAFMLSRCQPFFRTQQSNTRNVFWEPGDDRNEPSSSDVRSLTITSLVSF